MTYRLLPLCVVAFSLTALPAHAQTSTPEQFSELGNQLVGRWASQITLIADWPEFSKKQGEKVNGYTTIKWTANKHALIEDELIAEGLTKSIYFWDVDTKTIKAVRISSAGTTSTTTYWKANETWHWKHVSAQTDGKKLKGSGTLVFEEGGNVWIGDGTAHLDGEELPHYHDVYKRVDKP
ncbi:hypothetical protein [Novipirellula artificiosorum]|uniref:Uncharacterized protein n=1 Tax=Novipirellula artificiosorum TaxID=2528016 RepID=A0A5C6DW74_9BACT|nr:hypothetical protein [Novipirellula artificiosorum]TWU39306.1 hypothetical protein Poly41_21300 [Novipirellula artificiosorum]